MIRDILNWRKILHIYNLNWRDNMSVNIGFIGVGSMGTAIFDSLIKEECQITKSIYLYDIDISKGLKLKKLYDVNVASSVKDIASHCDVIVLAVRPETLDSVFLELSKVLTHQILISVAVGITLDKLSGLAERDVTIVRTMPNIGAMIGSSMTGYCVNKDMSENEANIIDSFLTCFGKAVQVKEEKFDEFTALCGSSPAFHLEIMESMINYGLNHQFSYEDTVKMVTETMITSAKLLQESSLSPRELIERIATKGGTTEAGLNVLKKYQIQKVINETLLATENESKITK